MNGFASIFSIIWLIIIFAVFSSIMGKNKRSRSFRSAGQRIEKVVRKLETRENKEADSFAFRGGDRELDPELQEHDAPHRPPRLNPGEARPAKSLLRNTSALSETLTEDRQHDWLARQIREEKKRVVWNNFVDLGAAHDEACAAELNRRDHKKHHQSYVVDDGELSN